MNDEIKARLPFGPESPWYRFVASYKELPLTKGVKQVKAHSSLLPNGVTISSTFTDSQEIGRVSFLKKDLIYLSPKVKNALGGWGWNLRLQGNDKYVFEKSLSLVDGASTMPMALTHILALLSVEPEQDWGY
jgi:hypothetical protein